MSKKLNKRHIQCPRLMTAVGPRASRRAPGAVAARRRRGGCKSPSDCGRFVFALGTKLADSSRANDKLTVKTREKAQSTEKTSE